MDTPAQVKRAVVLLWISLGLGAVQLLTSTKPLDPDDREWRLIAFAVSTAVWLIIAALIYLISRRHNWARMAYLALFVLTLAGNAFFPFDSEPWWSTALMVTVTLCESVALYWLFSGTGAQWYSTRQPA
jgi:hypothetical protein